MDITKTEPLGGKIIFIQISTNLISSSTDSGKIETLLMLQELRYLRFLKCLYIFISNILHHILDISLKLQDKHARQLWYPKAKKDFHVDL